jgi:hypothetical protein
MSCGITSYFGILTLLRCEPTVSSVSHTGSPSMQLPPLPEDSRSNAEAVPCSKL